MVVEVVQEDFGDGSMQCTDHPYKNNSPGGICAFCLQEKLGKLVSSSSFPVAVFPSSLSSSPSFRSDATSSIVPARTNLSTNISNTHNQNHNYNHFRKSRIPFLMTQKKKKQDPTGSTSDQTNSIIFKRSKSTATPRRGVNFMEGNEIDHISPHKRFWSFFHLSKHSTTKNLPDNKEICYPSLSSSSREKKKEENVVVEENESPGQLSFDRKVSRSRSVGCGSRSFSGDFFERISTGFGDCTLRRVESQREGKSRVRHAAAVAAVGQECIKERVKCGGLFRGFMITSSSTSSSSSSSNFTSTEDNTSTNNDVSAKPATATAAAAAEAVVGQRSKSWGWALASPIRAFKPSSGKRSAAAANKNAAPNLAAIPSLLAVRS